MKISNPNIQIIGRKKNEKTREFQSWAGCMIAEQYNNNAHLVPSTRCYTLCICDVRSFPFSVFFYRLRAAQKMPTVSVYSVTIPNKPQFSFDVFDLICRLDEHIASFLFFSTKTSLFNFHSIMAGLCGCVAKTSHHLNKTHRWFFVQVRFLCVSPSVVSL